MTNKHGPYNSPKLQVAFLESEEIDPLRCEISEEDMAQEDASHLIFDNDDSIADEEA